MINPKYKTHWRPQTDLGHHYGLNPELLPLEAYEPKNAADALAYLKEMALPHLVAYDGHPGQAGLELEEAATRWEHLFPDVSVTPPVIRQIVAQEVSYASI